MLNRESILEYAKNRDIPQGKFRGILREYLQTLILKFLYKHALGSKIYFLGGTCLRFLYGFNRFSEDLDFNGQAFSKKDFEDLVGSVQQELKRENLASETSFEYRGRLLTANLSFDNAILNSYQISDKRGQLMIKVEVHQPSWEMKFEEGLVNNFGELFPVLTMDRGYIFCEKMLALQTHPRGRHVYDLVMLLSKKFPMDDYVLRQNKVQELPKVFLEKLICAFPDKELKKMADSLRPFLFKEGEAVCVERAKFYVKNLLEKYEA